MGIVAADISASLDGFITGPNAGVEHPLGQGGERLHEWVYDLASWREPHGLAGGKTNRDAEIMDEAFGSTGAVVMDRRMFDSGEGPVGRQPSLSCARYSSLLTRFGRRSPKREAPLSTS